MPYLYTATMQATASKPVPAKVMGELLGGVHGSTVLDWYHAGIIPAAVAERHCYRFDPEAVKAALAKRAADRAKP